MNYAQRAEAEMPSFDSLRNIFYDLVTFYTRHENLNKAGKVVDVPASTGKVLQLFQYVPLDATKPSDLTTDVTTIPIKQYSGYLDVHNTAMWGEPNDWEHQTRNLALMAVGVYNALVEEAVRTNGGAAVVTSLTRDSLRFIVTANDGPSVADPAGFLSGWVAYRLNFAEGRLPKWVEDIGQ